MRELVERGCLSPHIVSQRVFFGSFWMDFVRTELHSVYLPKKWSYKDTKITKKSLIKLITCLLSPIVGYLLQV